MTVTLSDDQKSALDAHPGKPLRFVDDRTNRSYFLIPAGEDDNVPSGYYAAMSASAGKAGWDDPIMDEYNDYEENYRKLHGDAK